MAKKPKNDEQPDVPSVFEDAVSAPNKYPCWRYKKNEAVLVTDSEHEKALGKGWYDSPAKAPE